MQMVASSGGKRVAVLLVLLALWPIRAEQTPRKIERMGGVPPLVLWAWERPQDLRFLRSKEVGVAFLAQTVQVQGGDVTVRPRFQPLLVSEESPLIAVTRIEAAPREELSREQAARAAEAIAKTAKMPRVAAVQVDFDATQSQREFYRELLMELRGRVGEKMPLSITALASWCYDDGWMKGLPVDEAVPMLFRMGAGTKEVVTKIKAGHDFRAEVCRASLGVATDEPWETLPSGRRVYVFAPQGWSERTELAFLWEAHRWR
jgi:hypothetical protein